MGELEVARYSPSVVEVNTPKQVFEAEIDGDFSIGQPVATYSLITGKYAILVE